jgi:hypothetical protein
MAFRFDKTQTLKPITVSWKLKPGTVAALDEVAQREGALTEQVAQQMLDHVLRSLARGREEEAGA